MSSTYFLIKTTFILHSALLWTLNKSSAKVFAHQFKFLLLLVLQLFQMLRKIRPVKLIVQPLLDPQHFFRDATKGLRYLVNELLVVVKIIMGPCPQICLMSPAFKEK